MISFPFYSLDRFFFCVYFFPSHLVRVLTSFSAFFLALVVFRRWVFGVNGLLVLCLEIAADLMAAMASSIETVPALTASITAIRSSAVAFPTSPADRLGDRSIFTYLAGAGIMGVRSGIR